MFEIQGRKVGYDYDPLVIAEIGINHGGSLTVAKEMVDAAHRAGAEIVKHQTHIIEDEMSSEAKRVKPGNADISIYEIMKKCALNEQDEIELQSYVHKKGMIFISSPFSRAAANRLRDMNVPAFKIGSGECNNYPLLEHISSFGKPIILSTGMNSLDAIQKAVLIFQRHKVQYALLHTTNLYPTPNKLVRLGAMSEMANHFPGIPFGLSDHSLTNHACLGAVALGASILERHFTDHMKRVGPDIVCSMDEKECSDLIEGSKIIKQQRGGVKGALEEERVTMDFAFATVVTIKSIVKGDRLSKDNIWVKRPGSGQIPASEYSSLLNKRVNRDIKIDEHLSYNDIE